MKKILFGLMALGLLTACEEDYSKYAAPQAYGPESPVNIQITFNATNYVINMATDADKDIALFSYTTSNTEITNITANVALFNDTIQGYGKDGKLFVAANDVERLVGKLYGEHTNNIYTSDAKADIVAHTANGDGTFFEQTTSARIIPAAIPDPAATGGQFKLMVNDVEAGDFEKQADGTYLIVVTTEEANSSILFVTTDGTTVGSYNEDDNAKSNPLALNGSAKAINIAEPGEWKITLDVQKGTYLVAPAVSFLYYAGDANGWSFSPLCMLKDGTFEGFYYIFKPDYSSTWGFKFATADNWDEPQYGWSDLGKNHIALGGGNLDLYDDFGSGFYRIKVSKEDETYSVEPINVISIIGSATGDPNWGTDIDMTYDTTDRCWKVTTALVAGEMKFRVNHDWSLSWGAAEEGMTYENGANLYVSEAGTYTVKFHPECNGHGWWSLE